MGLIQSFRFDHDSPDQIEIFLKNFLENKKHIRTGKLLVITEYNARELQFELAIEDYGLYTHRSGDCFELLGCLLEELTAEFGKVEVDEL